MADRLGSSSVNRFLFGAQPSSLDAFLLGHLMFYRLSPAAVPVLKQKVGSQLACQEWCSMLWGWTEVGCKQRDTPLRTGGGRWLNPLWYIT